MIKKLRISCLGMLLAFGGLVIYGNLKIKHLDFQSYSNDENVLYYVESIDDQLKRYPYLKDMDNDDEIQSYNDLLQYSPNVLQVKINEVNFAGTELINSCQVTKVIKSDTIKSGDIIDIYSYNYYVSNFGVGYIDGSLPLRVGETYTVFIEQAPNPNVKDAYIFSSFKYGFFRLGENPRYLVNFNAEIDFTLKDAMSYDYITIGPDVDIYDRIYQEINNSNK